MNQIIAGIILLIALILGITIFHVVHHQLFCRYRAVPGKSHCGKCGHRNVCKKLHHKED